ncbi:MAG TPA: tetratricopeptide repeat protein, partial [Candidatus Methylomirabilis sp.]|nr:tetratricopeptide repeat protein [Candidatus Methylomirabilis sp.]
TMEAVTGVLLAESRVQPVCLVFEDLHWIDSETQAFLDGLIDILPVARVLLLVNYRPEYRHQWTGRTYFAQIRMDALPPSNAQALLRILLGPGDDLAAVGQKLIERTEGNPFFLEESVRALAEDGVLVGERGHYRLARPIQTIRVPATVQAVLAARMDRLAAEDKRLLQSASVIGENVPLALLRAVADLPEAELAERLTRLRNAEFLYESGLGPDPTDVFRHGLTCQVACDSLLQERRKALHGRIVDAIELLYPERLAEHVERLAHHSRGSERWDKAIRYLRQAGTKAFAHSANREAVAWLEQALEILTRLPDTAEAQDEALEIHLSLRNALTILGEHEQTLRHLGEARRLAEHTGDRRRLGRALSFEVNCLFLLGRHEQAIRVAARAAEIAGELGDVPLRTVTDMYAGRSHLYLGDFPRAIELFGGIVAALTGPLALDHLGIPVLPSVFARSHLVESLAEVGRFEEGERHAREALELAETTNHPDTLLWAFHGAGVHHLARGEPGPARQALEQAYSICRAHDMLTYRPRISSELGLAWALDGRAGEAVPMVEQAVEEAAARRQTTSYWQVLLLLAEVYLLADRVPESAKAAADALGHFREQRARGYEARALRLLGDVGSREAADAGAARAYYEEAVDLAERLGMRPLLGRACLGLGRLLARTGETARARQALEIASARFRESGMTADLARVEGELRVAGC